MLFGKKEDKYECMNLWYEVARKASTTRSQKLESDSNYQESILVINNAFGCLTVKFNESSIN